MRKNVYAYLRKNGVDCKYVDDKDEIEFNLIIENIECELCMKFPEFYPYEFPEIIIKDTKGLLIPHIYTGKQLCLYDEKETIPYPENYKQIALGSVERAKKLLTDSKSGENFIDYQLEIISYWNTKATGTIDFLGENNSSTHLMWRCQLLEEWNIVAEKQEKITEFVKNSAGIRLEKLTFKKALFINIGEQILIGIRTIGDIMSLIPEKEVSKLYTFLVGNSGKGVVVLCANNGKGQVLLSLEMNLLSNGVDITKKNIAGVLVANKGNTFKKLRTNDFQMPRLFTRGGDGQASFDKKCLLVGCGSVGSYAIKGIVDIGITDNITLLDKDILEIDNLARHLCGSNYLFPMQTKAEALRLELLKHYPTLQCCSMYENVLKFLLNDSEVFNEFNLILICVGNAVIEREVIRLIKEKKIKRECVILWVEPYLVAGHAVIIQNDIDEATENCLFDVNGLFNNNVLNNSRQYLKSEAGCQSAYAPYAGFEVQKFVLDFLDFYYRKIYRNAEKGNYEFTWLGKMKWARQKKWISNLIGVQRKIGRWNGEELMEIKCELNGLKVTIHQNVVFSLLTAYKHNLRYETGGILLGKFSGANSAIEIMECHELTTSVFSKIFYSRNAKRAQKIVDRRWRETKGICNYIGEWHTHPNISPLPSYTDVQSLQKIAMQVGTVLPGVALLIVGENEEISISVQRGDSRVTQHVYVSKEMEEK